LGYPFKSPVHHDPYENTAMAAEKEPLEAFTAMATQTADYFGWLQKTTSTFPWNNTKSK
jgi:hypothetical protein